MTLMHRDESVIKVAIKLHQSVKSESIIIFLSGQNPP